MKCPLKYSLVTYVSNIYIFFILGLGVRIEDDILITKGVNANQLSCEVLSKDCPKNINEIEDLMIG